MSVAAVPRKRVGAQGPGGGREMGSGALGAPCGIPHLRVQDRPSLCFRWLRRAGEGSEGCGSQDGRRDCGESRGAGPQVRVPENSRLLTPLLAVSPSKDSH